MVTLIGLPAVGLSAPAGRPTATGFFGSSCTSDVAGDAGLSLSQLALGWVLHNPSVSAAIIGASRPEQVEENIRASGVRLDADTMAAVDAVLGDVVERDPTLTRSPDERP